MNSNSMQDIKLSQLAECDLGKTTASLTDGVGYVNIAVGTTKLSIPIQLFQDGYNAMVRLWPIVKPVKVEEHKYAMRAKVEEREAAKAAEKAAKAKAREEREAKAKADRVAKAEAKEAEKKAKADARAKAEAAKKKATSKAKTKATGKGKTAQGKAKPAKGRSQGKAEQTANPAPAA